MECNIVLRNDDCVTIEDFKCAEYLDVFDKVEKITSQNVNELNILEDKTYKFMGSSSIVVKGKDILLIKFS
ncbi:hypothetical protein ACEE08_06485 [Staphylococcus rostri]